MDVVVYNQDFEVVGYVDTYDSLIWNIKYSGYGEFELVAPYSDDIMSIMTSGNYVSISDSDRTMIVEKILPMYDDEKGRMVKISGRSLESILSRRIVWVQTTITGNLQNGIKKLITDAIISPTISYRKIENFIFDESTDPDITSITIDDHQYTGDNLYDIIENLCTSYDIGFKILLNESNQFVFSLYTGINRTSSQEIVPIVEFSINNNNLLSSEYSTDETYYCNVSLVGGAGQGGSRKTSIAGDSTISGLDRKELFTDARDLSTTGLDNKAIPDATYFKMLIARGEEKLLEHGIQVEIDAEVDATEQSMYRYGIDYSIGDLVEVIDFLENVYALRIVQLTISVSDTGYSIHPIFRNEGISQE